VPAVGKNMAAGLDFAGEKLFQRLCGGIGNHLQSQGNRIWNCAEPAVILPV
jgi:hypothetical protein